MDREIEQPGALRTDEAPARPRRPVKPRGEGNLRDSEQRRMEREINEPGAPRTGEAPARRRRRAVVETAKPPKPQQQQEVDENDPLVVAERDLYEATGMLQMLERNGATPARIRRQREDIIKLEEEVRRRQPPRNVVEPKVVKPRRPKPAPGDSDNAARSVEVRAEAARQADAILANADRERAFAEDLPDAFLQVFMPDFEEDISQEERRAFKNQWNADQEAVDDVENNFERRILDGEFGDPDDLRERIAINDENISIANGSLERDLQRLRGSLGRQKRKEAKPV